MKTVFDKIALFGDSYIDILAGHPATTDPIDVPYSQKIWIRRLADELWMQLVNSGRGGSPLFYAINEWNILQSQKVDFQYAVWTLTWHQRLYVHPTTDYNTINQPTEILQDHANHNSLSSAAYLYKQFLYCDDYMKFVHERMVEWIMRLPSTRPDIRFIFIANNSYSLDLAKKYFTQGTLLDFAFEDISALEGEDVTHGPWQPNKFGHLTDLNHERFKNFVKPMFVDYESYRDQVVPVDISQFALPLSKA